MICGHPECTGVHNQSRSAAEWCPSARERRRKQQRKQARRLRRTPGTHAYNDVHGIGRAGALKQFRGRRYWRRRATAQDIETLRRLNGNR